CPMGPCAWSSWFSSSWFRRSRLGCRTCWADVAIRRSQAVLREHRRCLDFEARLGLDQAIDLDHRHGGGMPAHDLAIGGGGGGEGGPVFVHVAPVPRPPGEWPPGGP